MAERGAHLTTTLEAKPSIFEVIAQDSLAVTLHPALKRVATVKKN
jgi:peroxin-12